MKKILSLLVGMLVATVAAAQNSLPIQSQDVLREYALGKVAYGYRDVVAASMIQVPDQPTWTSAEGVGAEDVLSKLFGTELQYSLINMDDVVTGRVWLYDQNWNLLFFGVADYLVKEVGKAGPEYKIWMQSIPLLENVQSAEILALGEDGVTLHRYYPEIRNGRVMFDSGMSGAPNGILVVRFEDGSVMSYKLWNPEAQDPNVIAEGYESWKIDGHYVIPATEKDVVLVSIFELWTKPTVYLEVKKAGQKFKFDVIGAVQVDGTAVVLERPLSLIYTKQEADGSWVGSEDMLPNQPTTVTFHKVGIYRILFDWNKFGQANTLYTGPFGDGKGIAVAE
jgi:hypothetical protein